MLLSMGKGQLLLFFILIRLKLGYNTLINVANRCVRMDENIEEIFKYSSKDFMTGLERHLTMGNILCT